MAKKWRVCEYEGYTNKKLKEWFFDTREEALDHWQRRVDANKWAGVGGKYRHYFSYPEEVEVDE